MPNENPMLAVVIYQAATQSDGLAGAILNAAVHAWYEGHIAGEGEEKAGRAEAGERMPAPPFPSSDDPVLAGVVKQTQELFTSEELVLGAVSYAAGLAYAAGYAEGRKCAGCTYRGDNPEVASQVREGNRPVWLFEREAHLALPVPDETGRHEDLAARLCAAWLSCSQGLTAVDYTLRKIKARELGAFWFGLAALVEREMATAFSDALAGTTSRNDTGDA